MRIRGRHFRILQTQRIAAVGSGADAVGRTFLNDRYAHQGLACVVGYPAGDPAGVVLLQGVVIWGTGCMHDGRQRTEQRGQTTGAQHVFRRIRVIVLQVWLVKLVVGGLCPGIGLHGYAYFGLIKLLNI